MRKDRGIVRRWDKALQERIRRARSAESALITSRPEPPVQSETAQEIQFQQIMLSVGAEAAGPERLNRHPPRFGASLKYGLASLVVTLLAILWWRPVPPQTTRPPLQATTTPPVQTKRVALGDRSTKQKSIILPPMPANTPLLHQIVRHKRRQSEFSVVQKTEPKGSFITEDQGVPSDFLPVPGPVLVMVSRDAGNTSQPMLNKLGVVITHKSGGEDGYACVAALQPDVEGRETWRECTISSEAGQDCVSVETRETRAKRTELTSYLWVEVKTLRKVGDPQTKEIKDELD